MKYVGELENSSDMRIKPQKKTEMIVSVKPKKKVKWKKKSNCFVPRIINVSG